MNHSPSKTPTALVAAVVALFFVWGGITSLNDILIPRLKAQFVLDYAEAMLIQFAFFMAYALISVPAGRWVRRLGYGRGIVLGLLVMAAGCLMFLPAAGFGLYAAFLLALFVLAGGITILQVAANPLIAQLGSPETAHSRLTFAQAFNSLGTTVFPLVGAQLMLSSGSGSGQDEVTAVEHSYLAIALLLGLMALAFGQLARGRWQGEEADQARVVASLHLLREPRLGFGVLAMFLYVGAEVAIGSLLVNYLMQPQTLALDERSAGSYVALYWAGAMLGRFLGAGLLRLFRPGYVLACASVGAAALTLLSAASSGLLSAGALVAVGLMNAIMFPTIFSLAVEGLGERTPQGSGLVCMAIVGGAIVPVAVGALADASSLAASLLIPALCYACIAVYGRAMGRRR